MDKAGGGHFVTGPPRNGGAVAIRISLILNDKAGIYGSLAGRGAPLCKQGWPVFAALLLAGCPISAGRCEVRITQGRIRVPPKYKRVAG